MKYASKLGRGRRKNSKGKKKNSAEKSSPYSTVFSSSDSSANRGIDMYPIYLVGKLVILKQILTKTGVIRLKKRSTSTCRLRFS